MTAAPRSGVHRPSTVPGRPARLGSRGTLIAAIGYALAWIAGLSVFTSNAQVRADGAEVLRALAGHESAASLQYALTEGVTALCLMVVVCGVKSAGGPGRAGRTARLATLAATVISLAECGLGLWLSAGIARTGDASTAGAVSEAITRLDGAKMLLLALVALTIRAHSRLLPRSLSPLAVALAIAITVSGVGYLTLDDAAATAAWVSLPLLIIFITAAGLAAAGFPSGAQARQAAPRPFAFPLAATLARRSWARSGVRVGNPIRGVGRSLLTSACC